MSIAAVPNVGHTLARYARVLRAAWIARHAMNTGSRTPLERQFLPAALEIVDTPALPRAIMATLCAAFVVALVWSIVGQVDMVAVAPGKIIAADKTKVIQSAETAVVRRIHVRDGQTVKAGEILVELDAAATATAAETARLKDALTAARLESARFDALARAAAGREPQPALRALPDAGRAQWLAEQRALASQYQDHRARLAALDAEIAKREAEHASSRELAAKLGQTAPMARRRAEDYKDLVGRNFVSQHGYLDKEQVRIEQERDLAFQEAKVRELAAGVEEARRRRFAQVTEFERIAAAAHLEAEKKAAQLEQELVKASTRQGQQTLVAPVDGTVQQLAVHTVGGVVTPAQALLVIAPADAAPEVEAMLENRDVGFVKPGQPVTVKVETFPYTRYGTLPGTVSFVSQDAVLDEKRGAVFQVRVRLERATLPVERRSVTLSPGMAVAAEIATGSRRLISFFLDPLRRTATESLRER